MDYNGKVSDDIERLLMLYFLFFINLTLITITFLHIS